MPSPNLEELVGSYLDYLKDIRGYSKATVTTYEIALRQMVELSDYELGKKRLFLDIQPLRIAIATQHKRTINKKLSAIHSFVNYLLSQREFSVEIVGDQSVKAPKTLPKPLEPTQIVEALQTAPLQEQLIVEMLYGLGLRISELSELRLEDIGSEWIRVQRKGGKQMQLPLLPALHQKIEHYKEIATPKMYLFEAKQKPLSSGQLRYRVGRLFASLGIKATPHQLRHSFATHLLNEGARISDVSELLGHESMTTTQLYTKLSSTKKMQNYMASHPLAKG